MNSETEHKFWRIFCQVMRVEAGPGNVSRESLEEWDSLRHVELVFELEENFDVSVSPDEIVSLYSDSDTIIEYLNASAR